MDAPYIGLTSTQKDAPGVMTSIAADGTREVILEDGIHLPVVDDVAVLEGVRALPASFTAVLDSGTQVVIDLRR